MVEQAGTEPTKRRGRPAAGSITDKIAALEAQLAAAKAEAKEADTRRAAIVGRVVIDAFAKDEDLAKRVRDLLRDKVKNPRELADIAPLLMG